MLVMGDLRNSKLRNCKLRNAQIVCENMVDCETKCEKICVCFDFTKDISFKDQSENFWLGKRQESNYSFITWRDSDSTVYNYCCCLISNYKSTYEYVRI